MKRFTRFMVMALVIALVAAFFVSLNTVSAITDPSELTPGSNRVIFISDDWKTKGDGTGSDAGNPLSVIDHESFDPSAPSPKYHLQTPFYQATELLKEDGGTIVICGPIYLGIEQCYGSGAATRDTFTDKFGDNTIKFTSVYDGVDYRETAGAKITLATPAEIGVYGQSIWENIDIETEGKDRVISFNGYSTLVGEGVKCYPSDKDYNGVANRYVSLTAGHRYQGAVDSTLNLTVQSGTYNIIAGGMWGVNTTRIYNPDGSIKSTNNLDGKTVTNLVIEGTTTVYGQITGTNKQNSEFSGDSNITINGGTFECDINVVSYMGMINTDGNATLKINGGDFTNNWSINKVATDNKKYEPSYSLADFSDWNGSLKELAYAYVTLTEFDEIRLPAGVTVQMLLNELNGGSQGGAENGGDADDNGVKESDDAIYLLYSVLFGSENYPLTGDCDYDADGDVDSDDAIYLLYNVLFGGDSYPLYPPQTPSNPPVNPENPEDKPDRVVKDPEIEAVDYEGYAFRFLTQYNTTGSGYAANYLVSDGEGYDVISGAVYRRNKTLAEKYNIEFQQMIVVDLLTTVRTQVMGNNVEFDMIVGNGRKLATLAREQMLCDLNSVERFDMTNAYWDGAAAEQLRIGDKLYFTNCDINADEVGFAIYFNKQLIEDYKLTSPYEYMENNQWTIDNWAKLVTSVSKDLNGDGSLSLYDQFGTLYEKHNARMFIYGSGIRATTNNSNGISEVTLFETNKVVDVYEKCRQVFSSAKSWSIEEMDNANTNGYNDKYDYARSLFCQDLYLFHYAETSVMSQFVDMESEFGVVPFPKYDSEQKEYYSLYPYNSMLVAIPNNIGNMERTANIVEDLNYYSNQILKPAWFDTVIKRRYARDEESENSLDLIMEGRVYDLGVYYDFGGIVSQLLDQDVRFANISSNYARIKRVVEADIKATYRDFGITVQ